MRNLPFLEEILADLRRFAECVEDNNDVNLERSRFDLLVQLGLLERVQRSPARWMMTQAGEDAIAQPAAGEPAPEFFVEFKTLRRAMSIYGISAPESDHELGSRMERYAIRVIEAVAKLPFPYPPAAAHGDEAVLPERRPSTNGTWGDMGDAYSAGWNDCLDRVAEMRAQAGEGESA